jgi:uncharacterized protein YjbI with pentapeptide repeats
MTNSKKDKKVNSETFLEMLRGEKNNDPKFKDYFEFIYNRNFSHSEPDQKISAIRIKNLTVGEDVIVLEDECPYSFELFECRFEALSIEKNNLERVTISSTKITKDLIISGNIGHLDVFDCSIQNLVIQNGTFENVKIRLSTIYNRFSISECKFNGKVIIYKVSVEKSRSDENDLGMLVIHEACFNSGLGIFQSFIDFFSINSGQFLKSLEVEGVFGVLSITGGIFSEGIEFLNFLTESNVIISDYNQPDFYVSDQIVSDTETTRINFLENSGITFKGNVLIRGTLFLSYINAKYVKLVSSQLEITSMLINQVVIDNLSSSFFIYNNEAKRVNINELIFRDCTLSKDNTYNLNNVSVNLLKFENVINFGYFFLKGIISYRGVIIPEKVVEPKKDIEEVWSSFRNVKDNDLNPKLEISSSDLGKGAFLNCDFSSFELDFKNSKILDTFLAGTEMPEEVSGSNRGDHYQNKIAFGQIKKMYESRGDMVRANDFFVKEMNEYKSSVKWQWNPLKSHGENSEIINLYLNRVTNSYGKSWFKPLVWLFFVFGPILYTTYCYLLGFRLDWSSRPGDFYNLLGYFIEFLNPLHKADFLKLHDSDKEIVSSAVFIDSISRIILGYLIYQFIQAFRRHGKSSK